MSTAGRSLPKPFGALNRFARTVEERCELCATGVGSGHQHLIDPKTRQLLCACDGCALLFDDSGATKYKRVPRDTRRLDGAVIPEETWSRLLLPVKLAFFYKSSHAGKAVSIFPSPMGATEAVLEEEPWALLSASHPRVAGMVEDVEALLVSRIGKETTLLVAPIDRCFELIGILRTKWQGINGGDEVWPVVHAFLANLKEKAV